MAQRNILKVCSSEACLKNLLPSLCIQLHKALCAQACLVAFWFSALRTSLLLFLPLLCASLLLLIHLSAVFLLTLASRCFHFQAVAQAPHKGLDTPQPHSTALCMGRQRLSRALQNINYYGHTRNIYE